MKKSIKLARRYLIKTAYHEAAHAVVGYLVGAEVRTIAIHNPTLEDGSKGTCVYGFGPAESELELIATLAGPVAEAMRLKRSLGFWSLCRSSDGDYADFCRLFKSIHKLTDEDYLSPGWEGPTVKYISYMSARIKVQYLDPNWPLLNNWPKYYWSTGTWTLSTSDA